MSRLCSILTMLIAVCAIGAISASAAQAAPEYFTCVKASPRNSGKYADKECSKEVGTGGKFERVSAVGAEFKGKSGTVTLSTPGLGDVTCAKSTSETEVTGPSEAAESLILDKCAFEAKTCQSEGQKPGLIDDPDTLSSLSNGYTLKPVITNGAVAKFVCGGVQFVATGHINSTLSSEVIGRATKSWSIVFEGPQEALDVETLGEITFGPALSELTLAVAEKSKEPIGVT